MDLFVQLSHSKRVKSRMAITGWFASSAFRSLTWSESRASSWFRMEIQWKRSDFGHGQPEATRDAAAAGRLVVDSSASMAVLSDGGGGSGFLSVLRMIILVK